MDKAVKIRTEDLSFSYNGRTILRNTSMAFAEGEISAIVGPSGSGKSTFHADPEPALAHHES